MKRSSLFVLCLAVVATAAPPASASPARSERGRYIVVLRDSVDRPGSVAADHAARFGPGVSFVYRAALKGYAATLIEPAAARISRDPRVAWVELDRLMHATAQSLPTGVDRIQADAGSQVAGNGEGAVPGPAVAVIDTGIDLDHPDLNVIASVNYTGGSPFRKKCGTGGDDDNGHGTHVAGTVGARDDSNGVVGVAPGAPLVAVKVLNSKGSGYTSWIAAGIDWVAANAASRGIDVANMSLGGSGSDDGNCGNSNNDAMHKAVGGLVIDSGVTLVAAAGNSTRDLAGFVPAAYDEVLTVTAVADFNGQSGGGGAATCRSDVDDTAADFSNWAAVTSTDSAHTIAAPGVCIRSTWLAGGYNTISGTSMASPHVAGTVALCLSLPNPTCSGTPAQIATKLRTDAAGAPDAYGFVQDPDSSPISGRYYGYLEYAGGY